MREKYRRVRANIHSLEDQGNLREEVTFDWGPKE